MRLRSHRGIAPNADCSRLVSRIAAVSAVAQLSESGAAPAVKDATRCLRWWLRLRTAHRPGENRAATRKPSLWPGKEVLIKGPVTTGRYNSCPNSRGAICF